jgi:MFS family permease
MIGRMKLFPREGKNISLYYLTEFFADLIFFMPVIIAYQQQFLSLTQMGLLASTRYIFVTILELPTGVFADIWGRKTSCAFGACLDAVGLCIYGLFPSATGIIVATLIRAFGESMISGASTALQYDTLKEQGKEESFPKIASRAGMFSQTALIVATFLGGFLYHISPAIPFVASAIGSGITALLFRSMAEPHIDSMTYSWKNYLHKTKLGVQELFKHRYTTYLSLYFMVVAGITWSWMIYLNLIYLNSLGYDESSQGILLSVARLINILIINSIAVSAVRFTKRYGAWLHPLIMVTGTVLALLPNDALNLVAIMPLMLASTFRFVLLGKLTNEVFDSRHRATSLSALNLLMGFVYIIIVGSSGLIMNAGHPRWIYLWTGILPLPLILFLAYKMKQHYRTYRV